MADTVFTGVFVVNNIVPVDFVVFAAGDVVSVDFFVPGDFVAFADGDVVSDDFFVDNVVADDVVSDDVPLVLFSICVARKYFSDVYRFTTSFLDPIFLSDIFSVAVSPYLTVLMGERARLLCYR